MVDNSKKQKYISAISKECAQLVSYAADPDKALMNSELLEQVWQDHIKASNKKEKAPIE